MVTKDKKHALVLNCIAHLYFLLLGVFAFIFVVQRCSTADSAYTLFRLMNTLPFNIDDLRTLNPLTYFSVKTLVHYNMSFKAIFYAFSLSFILYYYILYLLNACFLKSKTASLAIILSSTALCFIYQNPALSILNSMFYLFLAYACVQPILESAQYRFKALRQFLFAIFTFLSIFSYPYIAVGFIILLLYYLFGEPRSIKLSKIQALFVFIFIVLCFIPSNFYFPAFLNFNDPQALAYSVNSYKSGLFYLVTEGLHIYLLAFLALFYSLYVFLLRKKYNKLFILSISFLLYIGAVLLKNGFSMEYELILLPYFAVFALIFSVEFLSRLSSVKLVLVGLVMLLCMLNTVRVAFDTQSKNNYFDSIYSVLPKKSNRLNAINSNFRKDLLGESNNLKLEFMMYSAFKHSKPTLVFFPNFDSNIVLYSYDALFSLPIHPTLNLDVGLENKILNKYYFGNLSNGVLKQLEQDFIPYTNSLNFICSFEHGNEDALTAELRHLDINSKVCPLQYGATEGGVKEGIAFEGRSATYLLSKKALEASIKVEPCDSLIIFFKVLQQQGESDSTFINRMENVTFIIENATIYSSKNNISSPTMVFSSSLDKLLKGNERPDSMRNKDIWHTIEIKRFIPQNVFDIYFYASQTNSDTTYFDYFILDQETQKVE